MADGYISQIKTPDNKVYLLKDSEKTDEKVKQTSNTEDKEFPILFKNANNATEETAGVKYSGNTTADATTTKPFTFNPSTGNLTVTQLKIGTKNDNMGLFPNLNNWNQIGSGSLYWYRSYINNYYGGRSHVDNWDSGKNIGTAATSSAAATKGTVNFYNSAAANATQTKTLLEANANTNSNITITLPSSTGTLALTSQIPTNLNQLTNGPGYVTSSGITSVTIGATSPVQSSTSTAQTGSSASTTISLKDAYGDTKNPYGAKAKNLVLAGPSSGNNAAPTFRALVAADIPDISGTYVKKVTSTDNAIARFDGTGGAIQNSSVKIDDNGHIIVGATQSIYQHQGDTSNYTIIATWLKNGKGWIKEGTTYYTYQPQIGQHNTGGDGTGSIAILPYATDTSPWGGTVGLFIRKGQMSLDNNCIPHTGNTTGSVGGTTTPVYVDGGVIKSLSYTIAKSVPADAVFTDHYAWGDITSKPETATRWPKWNEISQSGAESISEGTSDVTDNTEILTSYASNNGFADTNAKGVVYRRDAIHIYNYVNGKLGTMAHETASNYAKLASPALTGTPTAPTAANGTSTTQIATTAFVNNTLSYINAMRFKGTLGTGGTITALPASHEAGDTYRVITAGTWAGKYCEIGTLIICVKDGTAAADADWTSVETNEDGAVIGPSSSTDNAIARFDGATGRIIQNSGVTINDNNIITSTGSDINISSYKANEGEHGIFFRSGFFNDSTNKYNLSILTYDHGSNNVTPDGLSINANDGISFCTGANTRNERMRITFDGNVGIGTTSPAYLLDVNGTGRFSNELTLYRSGTTASNAPARINFTVIDADKSITNSAAYIAVYNDHTTTYNTNMVINSSGNTFIGAGESASTIYSVKGSTFSGENLFLSADSNVYIYAYADAAANRIGLAIDTNGNIIPQKAEAANNNAQNLGASDNRWATIYSTKFNGVLTPSSWINGQRYQNGALNIADYSNTGSYNPWIRATNTWASGAESAKVGRWFSFGTLSTSFFLMGSTTTRTENDYDHALRYDTSSGKLYCDSTEVSLSGHTHNESNITWSNGTLYTIGDDVYIGDVNQAGHLGLKSKQAGNTGLAFIKQATANDTAISAPSGTTIGKITWDGTKFSITSTTAVDASISGNAATATTATSATSANALNFVHTNELLLGNANSQSGIHINHRRVSGGATSGNTAITDYYFKNGNGATTGVKIHAETFNGNASTASALKDAGNSTSITAQYSGAGASATDWFTEWSGYKLVAVSSTDVANKVRDKASGSWGINITGTAATSTYLKCRDTRNDALNPTDLDAATGVRFDFKAKGTINLTATDPYAGVMSFRPYAHDTDWSGGNAHQIAFNSEGLHWRNGGASWGNWYQILDSDNTAAGANATANMTWGKTYTLAKINGTDIKITMPGNPNTDHYAWADITSKPDTATRWPTWSEVTGKPSTFAPSSHEHKRLQIIGRLNTADNMPYNPLNTQGAGQLSWCIYDQTSRNTDANGAPSFDAGVINLPWDWGGYNGQIAISNTVKDNTRMQIRSAGHIDNGEGTNPRYTPNYGAWREVVTATKATKIGDTNKPVYINATGQATAISYTIEKSVPSNAVFTDTNKYHKTGSWSGLTYTATAVNSADELKFTIPNKIQTDWELNATSGNSPALLFTRDSTLTDWKIFVTSGKLSFQSATNASTWTERAYFADNSGDFTVTGTMTATNFYGGGGNITLGTASVAVVTDANKKLSTQDLSVTDSNASTNATTTFVQAVTQSATGKITITKASLNTSGTWSGTATTASKLSNTSAIGSDVKPVYFTNGGVPQATATEMLRGFTTANAGTDLNAMYDSGTYSITGGTLTNYPTGGDKYATILTVAYRKPSGNTKPDYAWQMGNFTQNTNRMWYRTSTANAWNAWRQIVNIATNTGVGGDTTPVYVNANGEVTAGTTLGTAAYAATGDFAAASHGTHVTTATVQSALSINTSSGSATKALTEKGTFVTFGTSNLTIGTTNSTAMAGNTVVTNVAISANVTTNADYPIVFATSNKDTTAAKNEGLQKSGAKFYFNPSTGNVQATTFNGYTLATASEKAVVTTIDTSASLPTSNAVKTFVEGKGYVTSSGVTSVATGAGLTGGTITGTGTIKAYLKSETKATYDSATVTNTSGRQYAVTPDKTGYLSVNVPWTDNNTATATDNILDGSNSGTAITYAPYTAQQAKLSFDASTTAPTRTDRLNLNGFLYATKYNVAGHVTLQWNSTDSSLDFVFA